jgi:hypothetical protein
MRRAGSSPDIGYVHPSWVDHVSVDTAPHNLVGGTNPVPFLAESDAARLTVVAARLRALSSQRMSRSSHSSAAVLVDAACELAALALLAADFSKRSMDHRNPASVAKGESADASQECIDLARQDTFLVRR